MTADGVASHPLGQLFLSQNVEVATQMNGKALKADATKILAMQKTATNAVQATVLKSKTGSVAMGCGRQGGGQVIIEQPQTPATPSIPANPTDVPNVPDNNVPNMVPGKG
jgi:cytidine deaminase